MLQLPSSQLKGGPQLPTVATMPTDYPRSGREGTVALGTSAPAWLSGSTPRHPIAIALVLFFLPPSCIAFPWGGLGRGRSLEWCEPWAGSEACSGPAPPRAVRPWASPTTPSLSLGFLSCKMGLCSFILPCCVPGGQVHGSPCPGSWSGRALRKQAEPCAVSLRGNGHMDI